MNRVDGAYYVDFSLPSVTDGSITVWTNLFTIAPILTFMPSLSDYDIVYRDNDHMVLDVTPVNYECLPELIQICRDCVTVENMLEGVEVTL